MDALAIYHRLLLHKDAERALAEYNRAYHERRRRTLAAVKERICARLAENEARYRERMQRAAAGALRLS